MKLYKTKHETVVMWKGIVASIVPTAIVCAGILVVPLFTGHFTLYIILVPLALGFWYTTHLITFNHEWFQK